MKKLIQSLTVLLHAVVITAILTNLTAPSNDNTVNVKNNSPQFYYPTEAIMTTEL